MGSALEDVFNRQKNVSFIRVLEPPTGKQNAQGQNCPSELKSNYLSSQTSQSFFYLSCLSYLILHILIHQSMKFFSLRQPKPLLVMISRLRKLRGQMSDLQTSRARGISMRSLSRNNEPASYLNKKLAFSLEITNLRASFLSTVFSRLLITYSFQIEMMVFFSEGAIVKAPIRNISTQIRVCTRSCGEILSFIFYFRYLQEARAMQCFQLMTTFQGKYVSLCRFSVALPRSRNDAYLLELNFFTYLLIKIDKSLMKLGPSLSHSSICRRIKFGLQLFRTSSPLSVLSNKYIIRFLRLLSLMLARLILLYKRFLWVLWLLMNSQQNSTAAQAISSLSWQMSFSQMISVPQLALSSFYMQQKRMISTTCRISSSEPPSQQIFLSSLTGMFSNYFLFRSICSRIRLILKAQAWSWQFLTIRSSTLVWSWKNLAASSNAVMYKQQQQLGLGALKICSTTAMHAFIMSLLYRMCRYSMIADRNLAILRCQGFQGNISHTFMVVLQKSSRSRSKFQAWGFLARSSRPQIAQMLDYVDYYLLQVITYKDLSSIKQLMSSLLANSQGMMQQSQYESIFRKFLSIFSQSLADGNFID